MLFKTPIIKELSQLNILFEHRFNYLGFVLVTLLVIFIVLTFYFYMKFSEKERLNRFSELLLHETHHRIKNNFQLILSLLNMQMRDLENQEAISILKKNIDRIRLFSIIHDILSSQGNTDDVSMESFIIKISQANKNLIGERIDFSIDTKDVQLSVGLALPLGIIINELITNTIKYAFLKNKHEKCLAGYEDESISIEHNPKKIRILLEQKGANFFELIYQDSGPGIADWEAVKSGKGMGMKLIHGLSKQINGSVIYSEENNQFVIRFTRDTK